jgi:hypothetical protein
MKKALFSTVLAAAIAIGTAMAPALAEGTAKEKVKTSHVKKIKKVGPTVKNNTAQDDYYSLARETLMKISM